MAPATVGRAVAYEIELDEAVWGHLRHLTARERTIVFAAIDVQLAYEPLRETRNRKPLRPNPIAPWELRVRDLRVFYEVTPEGIVRVIGIGRKRGNVAIMGGKEISLWNT